MAEIAAREDHRVLVDRIGGIRREHDVAGPDRDEDEVGEALLRADDRDHFRIRIELHAVVTTLVPLGRSQAQVRNAARRRVAVVARLLGRLADLLHDVGRRRNVRVAHPEINHVFAGGACGVAQLRDLGEDVRRQTLELGEIVTELGHTGLGDGSGAPNCRPLPPRP